MPLALKEKSLGGGEDRPNLRLRGVGFSGNPRGRESDALPRAAVERNKLIGLLANSSVHTGEKQMLTIFLFIAVYGLKLFHKKMPRDTRSQVDD